MELGERALKFVDTLSFERVSGETGEHHAAQIILDELNKIGLVGWLESFDVRCGRVVEASLTTLPDERTILCMGYELSASADSLEGDLLYVEQLQPDLLAKANGKIVLMDGKLTNANYYQLVNSGARGFITHAGYFWDQFSVSQFNKPRLKGIQLSMKAIPGVQIHARDAVHLVASGCKKVSLSLNLCEIPGVSHNVVVEIPGTQWPDEVIVFTAHYDTVGNSIGSYDNASGAAMMIELARFFAAEPGKRTVRFVWCGSEEIGLEGARAYVKQHAQELPAVRLVINADLIGSAMGADYATVMAGDDLIDFIRHLAQEEDVPAIVTHHVIPGDCTVFVDKGIPAVGFGRYGTPETCSMHDCNDQAVFLSAAAMEKTIRFAYRFSREVADREVLPFASEIPMEMRRMVDEYLFNEVRHQYEDKM